MSERCNFQREADEPRCNRASQGSLGMMRFCRRCFAGVVGCPENDPRLKQVMAVQLTNGATMLSVAQWIPDVAISRAKQRKRR